MERVGRQVHAALCAGPLDMDGVERWRGVALEMRNVVERGAYHLRSGRSVEFEVARRRRRSEPDARASSCGPGTSSVDDDDAGVIPTAATCVHGVGTTSCGTPLFRNAMAIQVIAENILL